MRGDNYASSNEMAGYYKTHKFQWFMREAFWSFNAFVFAVAGIFQLLFGNLYTRGVIEIAFMILWGKLCVWLLANEKAKQSLDFAAVMGVLFVPPLFVIAYMGGLVEGFEALSKTEPVYFGMIKGEEQESSWYVLRNLSRGVIVRELKSNQVSFVKWDDISAFHSQIKVPDTRPLLCRLTGWKCPASVPKEG